MRLEEGVIAPDGKGPASTKVRKEGDKGRKALCGCKGVIVSYKWS